MRLFIKALVFTYTQDMNVWLNIFLGTFENLEMSQLHHEILNNSKPKSKYVQKNMFCLIFFLKICINEKATSLNKKYFYIVYL